MWSAYNVGEVSQPNSERIIFGMSFVRPDSFEHELRVVFFLRSLNIQAVMKRKVVVEKKHIASRSGREMKQIIQNGNKMNVVNVKWSLHCILPRRKHSTRPRSKLFSSFYQLFARKRSLSIHQRPRTKHPFLHKSSPISEHNLSLSLGPPTLSVKHICIDINKTIYNSHDCDNKHNLCEYTSEILKGRHSTPSQINVI